VIGQWIDWNRQLRSTRAYRPSSRQWLGTLADDLLTAFGRQGRPRLQSSRSRWRAVPTTRGALLEPWRPGADGQRPFTPLLPSDRLLGASWPRRALHTSISTRITGRRRATSSGCGSGRQCYDVRIPAAVRRSVVGGAARQSRRTISKMISTRPRPPLSGCPRHRHIHHNEAGDGRWPMSGTRAFALSGRCERASLGRFRRRGRPVAHARHRLRPFDRSRDDRVRPACRAIGTPSMRVPSAWSVRTRTTGHPVWGRAARPSRCRRGEPLLGDRRPGRLCRGFGGEEFGRGREAGPGGVRSLLSPQEARRLLLRSVTLLIRPGA
jgi:hypothetical protein